MVLVKRKLVILLQQQLLQKKLVQNILQDAHLIQLMEVVDKEALAMMQLLKLLVLKMSLEMNVFGIQIVVMIKYVKMHQ
jgi:hypothetical protein